MPKEGEGFFYRAETDGCSTHWTQQLLSNRKERLLISGMAVRDLCPFSDDGISAKETANTRNDTSLSILENRPIFACLVLSERSRVDNLGRFLLKTISSMSVPSP